MSEMMNGEFRAVLRVNKLGACGGWLGFCARRVNYLLVFAGCACVYLRAGRLRFDGRVFNFQFGKVLVTNSRGLDVEILH